MEKAADVIALKVKEEGWMGPGISTKYAKRVLVIAGLVVIAIIVAALTK